MMPRAPAMIACHAAAVDAAGVVQTSLVPGQPVSTSTVIGFGRSVDRLDLLEARYVEGIISWQGTLRGSQARTLTVAATCRRAAGQQSATALRRQVQVRICHPVAISGEGIGIGQGTSQPGPSVSQNRTPLPNP